MQKVNNGISIIICSIDSDKCARLLDSIKSSIGIDFESIIFNNKEKNWGICKVYNYCAAKARYPFLCFLHEDVIIKTFNWGNILINFMVNTSNCGVIGFAGGTTAKKNFLGWGGGGGVNNGRYRYYDPDKENKNYCLDALSYKYNNPKNEKFAEVITLDGFFLFVSREVWEINPFDEKLFSGFHFYDADFSFGVAQSRQNYVCFQIDAYHYSNGNPDATYYENAKIFQTKWKYKLPCVLGDQKISFFDEFNSVIDLLNNVRKYNLPIKKYIAHIIKINGYLFFICIICRFIYKLLKKF